jgi:kynurenine formamidase
MDLTQLSSVRVVDLSVTLSKRLPGTWPGHMTFAHHNWNWFAEVDGPTGRTRSIGPYQTNFLVVDEHCGTHFPAPPSGAAHTLGEYHVRQEGVGEAEEFRRSGVREGYS